MTTQQKRDLIVRIAKALGYDPPSLNTTHGDGYCNIVLEGADPPWWELDGSKYRGYGDTEDEALSDIGRKLVDGAELNSRRFGESRQTMSLRESAEYHERKAREARVLLAEIGVASCEPST